MRLERIQWSDEAHQGLKDAMNGFDDDVKSSVMSGDVRLYRVFLDGVQIGLVTLCIDEDDDDYVFVEAYQGKRYVCFFRSLVSMVKKAGFKGVGCYTEDERIKNILHKKTGCNYRDMGDGCFLRLNFK